jgi:hypothetical protein
MVNHSIFEYSTLASNMNIDLKEIIESILDMNGFEPDEQSENYKFREKPAKMKKVRYLINTNAREINTTINHLADMGLLDNSKININLFDTVSNLNIDFPEHYSNNVKFFDVKGELSGGIVDCDAFAMQPKTRIDIAVYDPKIKGLE